MSSTLLAPPPTLTAEPSSGSPARVTPLPTKLVDPKPQISYPLFVNRLMKPGEALALNMTPQKLEFLHLVCGFSGELAELSVAMTSGDLENRIEEFGDFEFYMQDLHTRLSGFAEDEGRMPGPLYKGGLFEKLAVAIGELVDVVKRYAIYNKPLNEEAAWTQWHRIRQILDSYYFMLDLKKEDIIVANKVKLDKRYSAGTYSDAQATARADKPPGE